MSNLDEIAEKNNYKGIAISVLIHLIILLLFLWVAVWEEPYPPNPEIGIELNFGTSNQGSGETPVAATQESETIEELQEQPTEDAIDEVSSAPTEEEVTENDATESTTEEQVEAADNAVTQEEGPVEATKKESTKAKEESTDAEKKATSKPAEEQKPVVKEKPKTNPNALFPGKNDSQGATNDKKGDQGKEDGDVDATALMGPQGGGSGSRLDMSGWAWVKQPRPKDTSDQNGQIIFIIKVDDQGEVTSVVVHETTVSPDVVRIYQAEVEKLSFYKTSAGTTLNSYTGKITFLIRSN